MSTEDELYRAMTNGREPPSTVAGMVEALGGTRAAAAALGITQRTVQRWTTSTASQRRTPPAATVTRLRAAVRASPAIRSALVTPRRAERLRRRGTFVKVSGTQGPAGGGGDYVRPRDIGAAIPGELLAPVVDAFLAGDDDAAAAALEAALSEAYVPDWRIEDASEIDFRG